MLNKNNVLVYVLRMAKDHFVKSNTKNERLRLINGCTYRSCEFETPK